MTAAATAPIPRTVDIAIVGGGGIGSAIAYFLTRAADGPTVAVFEPDPSYSRASTALSAGGIRQQFSTRENILMSRFGYEFLECAAEELAVGGERPSVGLIPRPYLRLVDTSGESRLRQNLAIQRDAGADIGWLDPAAIIERFPWLNPDGIAAAVIGNAREGVFDPYGLLQGLRRKSIAQGARYVAAAVTGFEKPSATQVTAVILADGTSIGCGTVIDAAGPAAAAVAAMAGLSLPVRAVKAHTFAFRPAVPIAGCPVVIDQTQNLQFRPEGDHFICGMPSEDPETDATGDFTVDETPFEEIVWPALAHRVFGFETLKLTGSWVGHIELNPLDYNPIIGRHPECRNFVFANGFSGHGIQHAPAVGRAIAELLLEGGYRSIDLDRLGYERLVSGALLPETA